MPFDPILIHPNLAAKATDPNQKSTADDFSMVGGLGGLALGFAAAHAARHVPALRAYAPATVEGVMNYAGLGGALGFALGSAAPVVNKLRRHAAARQQFEAETGQRVPFQVAHPYMMDLAPAALGTVVGAAAAPKGSSAGLRAISGATGALLGGLALSPYANYVHRQREAYFEPYRTKMAQAALVDPRLLHPILADRPKTLEESARRRENIINYVGPGAAIGGAGGFFYGSRLADRDIAREAAALAERAAQRAGESHVSTSAARAAQEAVQAVERHAAAAPKAKMIGRAGGAAAGALLGAAAALGARKILLLHKQMQDHDAAVKAYEQQTGQRIPLLARHPFAASFAPTPIGAAVGAALAPKMVGLRAADRAIGGTVGATIGALAAPMLTGASWRERKRLFADKTPSLSADQYAIGDFERDNTAEETADAEKQYAQFMGDA